MSIGRIMDYIQENSLMVPSQQRFVLKRSGVINLVKVPDDELSFWMKGC